MTRSGSIPRRPVLTTARIGVILFLVTEVMLFAGLLTAFLVLKGHAPVWPPPGQPRLPVAATAVNTVVLLLSGAAMLRAVAQSRRIGGKTAAWLAAAAGLGLAFLVGQGIEWVRLLGYGFTTGSGVYGSTFYLVVGIHAAHVLVAVLALAVICALSLVGQITPAHREPVVIVAFFWLFVVLVWPILYLLLYQPWAPR
ncbi:MAG TPA: cytochrome c oxidase subunit 3 [Candidatus Eisenbacteria bacterium]|nr:cytochrome c oxidase subunit 3 [Candidatus Eisenbacteria bacterium]